MYVVLCSATVLIAVSYLSAWRPLWEQRRGRRWLNWARFPREPNAPTWQWTRIKKLLAMSFPCSEPGEWRHRKAINTNVMVCILLQSMTSWLKVWTAFTSRWFVVSPVMKLFAVWWRLRRRRWQRRAFSMWPWGTCLSGRPRRPCMLGWRRKPDQHTSGNPPNEWKWARR